MPPSSFLFILFSLALLTGAGFILWQSRETLEASGLPAGDIIYADSEQWHTVAQPLTDPNLQLVGKPDYLVMGDAGTIIPVELKSGKAPSRPHIGHIFQLAAYCVLVHREYGSRPNYGIIQYADNGFEIDFTPELEADLLNILADMRDDYHSTGVTREHNDWRRCAKCGVRQFCDQPV